MTPISTSPSSRKVGQTIEGAWERPRVGPRPRDSRRLVGVSRGAAGRYHLYVSLACPWAHRTIIVRRLKGLEDVISMSVVDPIRDERGWTFTGAPGTSRPGQRLRVPVRGVRRDRRRPPRPRHRAVLWDRDTGPHRQQRVVRDHPDAEQRVRRLHRRALDLYPEALRAEIDAVNDVVYTDVNNGVYKGGFARSAGGVRGGGRTRCSRRSTSSRRGSRASATCSATRSPRRTGGCSPRWCASTRSTRCTSSATCARHRGLPESVALPARPVPGARRRRDGRLRPHQAPLLPDASVQLNPTRIVPISNGPDPSAPHGRG